MPSAAYPRSSASSVSVSVHVHSITGTLIGIAFSLQMAVADANNPAPNDGDSTAVIQQAADNSEFDKERQTVVQMQAELMADLNKQLKAIPPLDPSDPLAKVSAQEAIQRLSQRGDLLMFTGRFSEAVADYQQMVKLDPQLDRSHWRLGIAHFYADSPEAAAGQFDRYHSFDDVDRENGIWRYLSHYKAFGKQRADQQLLKYSKDDRPPFAEVYQMFEGRLTADQVLAAIPDKKEPGQQISSDVLSRQFYSHLYIGLNEVACGRGQNAEPQLLKAIQNPWPRHAGYGPAYMWHVGRLQYFLINPIDSSDRLPLPPSGNP